MTVASGCEIVFVAPARIGDVLRAEATERTRFGRSGIYDVTVRRGTDVIAEFRGRSRTVISVKSPTSLSTIMVPPCCCVMIS